MHTFTFDFLAFLISLSIYLFCILFVVFVVNLKKQSDLTDKTIYGNRTQAPAILHINCLDDCILNYFLIVTGTYFILGYW